MRDMAERPGVPPLPLRWPGEPAPIDPLRSRPAVEIRRSSRRRKTAVAHWEGNRIVVVVPSHVRAAEQAALVDWLVERLLAKRPNVRSSDHELADRAAHLADRYVNGVRPASIRWVTNQGRRWGSCSTESREIRLSHRLRVVPEWVLDATIVHELAHLLHPNHSPQFHQVADRFPRQRDATIYLDGYSLGLDRTSQPDDLEDVGTGGLE